MERFRRNKMLLCFTFLLNQSAFSTLESLQSSLNQRKGTNALAVLYVCMVLSALLLPSYVISKFGCKKSILSSLGAYGLYIIANFYPSPYTLIPAAALLGIGSGIYWPTAFTYVTRMSSHASKNNFEEFNRINKETFATLFVFVFCSMVVGSLVMIVMLFSVSSIEDAYTVNLNSTDVNISEKPNKTCGLFHENVTPLKNGSALNISNLTLYVILSGFLLLNSISMVLSSCLDDYPEHTLPTPQFVETVKFSSDVNNEEDKTVGSEDHSLPVVPEQSIEDGKTTKEKHPSAPLKATLKLLATDLVAVLLLPHAIHVGMGQAFLRGTYFASWISCNFGLYYVSYMMLVFALTSLLTSYTSAKLLAIFNHRVLFGLSLFLELIVLITLLLWHTSDTVWPFFLVTVALGSSRSLLKTQTPSFFATFFQHKQGQAASLQSASEAIGVSVTFGLMSCLAPIHVIALLIAMSLLAYLLVNVCVLIQDNPKFRNISCGK